MVLEAEEFADADKKVKGKVDARNKLETYVYQIKSSVEDKLKGKVRRPHSMPAEVSWFCCRWWLPLQSCCSCRTLLRCCVGF